MVADALTAANAYRNQSKLMQDGSNAVTEDASAGQPSFSQMVEDAVKGSMDQGYKSENLQMQSLTSGNVDLTDLVTAVSNAELTLNTVVAIRDRVIGAYQDILRMSI